MAGLPAWRVKFQKAEDGSDPIAAFISNLPPPALSEWEALVELLRIRGDTLKGNRVLVHENGLREFQGDDDVRIFYKRINAVKEIRVFGGCRGDVEKTQFEAFLREAQKA